MTDPATIAASLTPEQREWILAMPDIPVAVSGEDWENSPDLFVQFTPDEHSWMHWFGAMQARGTKHGWEYTAWLNDLGLAIRRELER